MSKRVFWIVLDSAGIGAGPDASAFGDEGANTFGTCYKSGKLNIPAMESLGLYNIDEISFGKPVKKPKGAFLKLSEKSAGKDTTMGHWEMAGMISERPLPTYPDGFPEDIIIKIEEATGRKVICNKAYSGTQVIHDYGKEQIKTGALIVYTSADSVLQIAAHEDVIPLEELYEDCKKVRKIMQGEHGVGRIIARPYIGEYPDFTRTVNRHDFSLEPPHKTVLDAAKEAGLDVIGVGKIYDIFAGKGLTRWTPNEGNKLNMEKTLKIAEEDFNGICYINLVDFDMTYGHRRDIPGYTEALNEADRQIKQLMSIMKKDDILMITADHGCDPGFTGTDHTREYVPCLIYGEKIAAGTNVRIRESFSDMAATISEYLGLDYKGDGESFWSIISK